jgi:hypothetical protein
MTRLARKASPLVAFYLLMSAATAYAECAWVLWTHFVLRDGDRWLVNSAFDSGENCGIAAVKALAAARGTGAGVVAGGVVTMPNGDLVRAVCLPDGVDPRGPKAK